VRHWEFGHNVLSLSIEIAAAAYEHGDEWLGTALASFSKDSKISNKI
jgi:bifunctional pyridoxal-dependent enzyme with beta-cystathionase and maltose regulon repressor activities